MRARCRQTIRAAGRSRRGRRAPTSEWFACSHTLRRSSSLASRLRTPAEHEGPSRLRCGGSGRRAARERRRASGRASGTPDHALGRSVEIRRKSRKPSCASSTPWGHGTGWRRIDTTTSAPPDPARHECGGERDPSLRARAQETGCSRTPEPWGYLVLGRPRNAPFRLVRRSGGSWARCRGGRDGGQVETPFRSNTEAIGCCPSDHAG
jgi:hypothetical protein